jgi:tetratricopeptide (TPR) repeat protein
MTSAIFARGIQAFEAGDLSAAERAFLSIVEQNAGAHDAWHALSKVALRAGLPDIGVERARRAVELDRRNPAYLNSLGIAHSENGEPEAAEQAFRRALKVKPAYAEARYNLGKLLRDAGRLAEALKEYERAHALAPSAVPPLLGLAAAHRLQANPQRALAVLRGGVGAGMPDPDVIPYFADALADVEGPDAALAWLNGLLARDPGNQQAHHILGMLLLSLGRWREGWTHHLWRAHRDAERMRVRPALLPERLDGRRVFLRAEEGIGDILFYLRFGDELRRRGAAFMVEIPPHMAKLAPLLAGRFETGARAPEDLPLWIVDLPAALQTEAVPPAVSLNVSDVRIASTRARLAALGPPPYLSLTWRAGTDPRRARGGQVRLVFKEIGVEALGQAVRGWRGTFLALQRNAAPGELEALGTAAGAPVHDVAAMTEDLNETVALLAQIDEHVAVINTNMHLLAGLGRPARVLVPRPLDWRWMRDPGDSVWFPGFSVYREPATLDWTEPLMRLRNDLTAAQR